MLLVSGRVSVPKPLSQIQSSTRWLLQGLSPRTSFGGFGLKLKNDEVAGEEFGTEFSGLHHIGFQVEDAGSVDARLQESGWESRSEMNQALEKGTKGGLASRNAELRSSGPDGALLAVSQRGWVGTGAM